MIALFSKFAHSASDLILWIIIKQIIFLKMLKPTIYSQTSYLKETESLGPTSLIFSVQEGVGTLAGALDVFKVG